VAFTDRLSQALGDADFTPDERTYATHEQCGTFALALYDLLVELEQEPVVVAFGQDPAWHQPYLTHAFGYKLPGLIRRSHLNHIAIRLQDRFFDIKGGHDASSLASTYDANGMIILERAILRRKIGSDPRQPLYFDGAFYLDVKRRLASHLTSPAIRL
jgi:hypothetical protein